MWRITVGGSPPWAGERFGWRTSADSMTLPRWLGLAGRPIPPAIEVPHPAHHHLVAGRGLVHSHALVLRHPWPWQKPAGKTAEAASCPRPGSPLVSRQQAAPSTAAWLPWPIAGLYARGLQHWICAGLLRTGGGELSSAPSHGLEP